MPAVPLELHPAAIEDAAAARRWYLERSQQAADAFVAEVDRAVEMIAGASERWPEYIHGTRRFLLRRFPYSLVYRRRLDGVEVIAVAHARRRPGYWRSR
jgi:plasmid stabilization system protein ParE